MTANYSRIYWLFGLPEAGTSELAQAFFAHFQATGYHVTLVSGDELRAGLCEDLGFTEVDQREKVRRGAHMAKALAAAGGTVVCSFRTTRESHRTLVRQILGENVRLIYIRCGLQDCPICQRNKQQQHAAETAKHLIPEAVEFEPPVRPEAQISTHNRPMATSLQALFKLAETAFETTEPKTVRQSAGVAAPTVGLSAREMEVMALLSQGLRHKEMAGRLGISVTTVRTHLERASAKLSASSRTEAVARFVTMKPLAS